MPQIKLSTMALYAVMGIVLSGCGDSKPQTIFNKDSGKHTAGWLSSHPAAATSSIDPCTECHGSDYKGGISSVGCMSSTAVSGMRCHAGSPANDVIYKDEANRTMYCASCHGGWPNGPYGDNLVTSRPNRGFAHSKHTGLLAQLGVTGKTACDVCHYNAGSGTANHARATAFGGYTRAALNIQGFRAMTVTAYGYDAASAACSGISCHGGQTTTSFRTGSDSIVKYRDCLSCHAPYINIGDKLQYNSYYSGTRDDVNLHEYHLAAQYYRGTLPHRKISCTDCHNVYVLTDVQKHFGGIFQNSFVYPAQTVSGGPTFDGYSSPIGSYNAQTKTCFNVLCHSVAPKAAIDWIK
jgi:hypothetical protein